MYMTTKIQFLKDGRVKVTKRFTVGNTHDDFEVHEAQLYASGLRQRLSVFDEYRCAAYRGRDGELSIFENVPVHRAGPDFPSHPGAYDLGVRELEELTVSGKYSKKVVMIWA